MFGKLGAGSIRPNGLGVVVNSSVYGQVIPVVYGRTRGQLYLTWANGFRHGGSNKKKASISKKEPPTFIESCEFLLGHNPIGGVLQFWMTRSQKFPLNFLKWGPVGATGGSITVSDPNFYYVIGVTAKVTLAGTFNDYGGNGPMTYSVPCELPLWNAAYAGPDPTNENAFRSWFNDPQFAGAYYRWVPYSGNVVEFDPGGIQWDGAVISGGGFYVYYAALAGPTNLGYKIKNQSSVPATELRLTFEPILGDGPEYVGYTAQQIKYPQYAGLGSANFDLGSSGALPQVQVEIVGSHPYWPTGDAEFPDMAEDILKQGFGQSGFDAASTQSSTQLQRGLALFDFPGCVQRKIVAALEEFQQGPVTFDLPNTAGNILVVLANSAVSLAYSISDTAGNTWIPLVNTGYSHAWYCVCVGANQNTVTVAGLNIAWQVQMYEIAGVDSVDATVVSTGAGAVSVTTTNTPKQADFLLLAQFSSPSSVVLPITPFTHWNALAMFGATISSQWRTVNFPGTYTVTWPNVTTMVILALKATQPASYAKPLGNILDDDSMQIVRRQCRANGLKGSLIMDSQRKAADWLSDVYEAMDAWPLWSGFKLKSIARSEVSLAGNGATYVAPTAGGPVADLSDADFIGSATEPMITVEHATPPIDQPNILQIQYPNRDSDYNDVVAQEPCAPTIALYGPRKDSPKQFRSIADTTTARMVLGIMVRYQNFIKNTTYKFKLKANWKLLEPGDLVTLTDPQINMAKVPVRLISVDEDADWALQCEAEPFIYGAYAPQGLVGTGTPAVTAVQPYQPGLGVDPGDVNAPIIFQPPAKLAAGQSQLWIAVSGSGYHLWQKSTPYTLGQQIYDGTNIQQVTTAGTSGTSAPSWNPTVGGTTSDSGVTWTNEGPPVNQANWGGCDIWASLDNATYSLVARQVGQSTMGLTTANWPSGSDPDTVNTLGIDLTESNGSVSSQSSQVRDSFSDVSIVTGGGSSCLPYELMAYGAVTLTSAFHWNLLATGAGNSLRRGCYGTTISSHGSGSQWAQLLGGIVTKIPVNPAWYGKLVYFKFTSFNMAAGAEQSLGNVAPYTFTPQDCISNLTTVGAQNFAPDTSGTSNAYVISPSPCPGAYAIGQTYTFTAGSTNTGPATLNVCGLGAKPITKNFNQPLTGGEIQAGQLVSVYYDGTEFQIQGGAQAAPVGVQHNAETPSGSIPGSAFTLAVAPSPASSLMLFRNGVLQTAGGVDYTLSGVTITYVTPMAAGDSHIAWYVAAT